MIEYYHAPIVSLQLPGFWSPTQHRPIASPSPINLAGMGSNTSHPNALLSRWFSRVPLGYLVIYMVRKLGTTNPPMTSKTPWDPWHLKSMVSAGYFLVLPTSSPFLEICWHSRIFCGIFWEILLKIEWKCTSMSTDTCTFPLHFKFDWWFLFQIFFMVTPIPWGNHQPGL